jgi:hypothetical protein
VQKLAESMTTKRKWIVATAVILLLPILLAIVMHREVAGSMTIFTVRATPLRIYYSNSGNLGFAVRSDKDRLRDCDWIVTRKNKVAWSLVNVGAVYIALPYLVADVFDSNG